MALEKTFVPYGAYWSSPFCRWQGSIGHLHSMKLAAQTTGRFLDERQIAPDAFDGLVLGITVHQRRSFYGAPWLAGMIGADGITGPTVAQACATSARMLATAALEVESGQRESILTVALRPNVERSPRLLSEPQGHRGYGRRRGSGMG